jgi:hypothetical protein
MRYPAIALGEGPYDGPRDVEGALALVVTVPVDQIRRSSGQLRIIPVARFDAVCEIL